MTALTAAAKAVLSAAANLYFLPRFKAACARAQGGLLVVDIDNTIAATHSYEKASPGRVIHIEALEPIPAVAAWLAERAPAMAIVYITARLSARNLGAYRRTARWLRQHGFPEGELILVSTPAHKLKFLRHACRRLPVTFIDDLSYLDADGTLRFHDEVIRKIGELNINYLGYDAIAAIVAGERPC